MTIEVTQDGISQTDPTPSTIWGGDGYSTHYVEDISERPDPRLPWCVTVEGVGSWPIAWFYQKADAENYVRLVAEKGSRNREGAQDINAKDEWIAFQSWWKRHRPGDVVPSPASLIFDAWVQSARHHLASPSGEEEWERAIDDGLVSRFRSALRFAASSSVISSADEQALLAALRATDDAGGSS